MNNYDSNTTEINFRSLYMCSSYTCAVVILHYPSGHPTSLIEHLQNVELAARITSLLPPALISGSVQLMLYLLIVIIHVSVGNIVWLDLSVDNRYPNVDIISFLSISHSSCRYFINAANDLLEDDSELAYMPFDMVLDDYTLQFSIDTKL